MAVSGTKRTAPFVVAYGEEEFLLDRVVALGRSWKDRHVVYLDGDGMDDFEVVSYCETSAYDARLRVVVLDNANKVKETKSASLVAYVEGKAADDDSVVLVAVLRSDKLAKVWQMAAAKGRQEHCKKLKAWETDAVKARIADEAMRLKLKLDDDVPDLFLAYFGDNLRRVANELQKLSLIAVDGKVTKKEVALVVAPDLPMPIDQLKFEVVRVATNKEPKKALRLVALLFKTLGDDAARMITASLLSEIEKLIQTRQMLDHNVEIKTIAEALGIPPYPVQKDIAPRARKHTVPDLLRQMNKLCRLDAQVKGAARSKRTLVELAVLSIAA